MHGLHHFNVDLKKAAKLFANKFGAGATVSKTAQGDEEILIQGDVSVDVSPSLLAVLFRQRQLAKRSSLCRLS